MPSAWDTHLKDYRKKHPSVSLKEAMIGASKTYTKSLKTSKKQGSGRLETDEFLKRIKEEMIKNGQLNPITGKPKPIIR